MKQLTQLIGIFSLFALGGCGGGGGGGGVGTTNAAIMETVLYSFVGGTSDGANPQGNLIPASDGTFSGMTLDAGSNNKGAVFKITASGSETLLHSFGSGSDGVNPYGSLIQASDGYFYGMTRLGGGANNLGTVFEITPTGAEAVLYSFAGSSIGDGAYPTGNLIQASDGNLYGMTSGGGTSNLGTVFKINMSGAETVLHSFGGGTTDGSAPMGSLIQATDGNFYGMTFSGGTNNLGTVFKITPAGVLTVLHSFGGTGDGASPYGSLVQASDGNLYGMTPAGGSNKLGTVFKVGTAGGSTYALLYSFAGGTSDGSSPAGSLIQASNGDLYGMTKNGGSNGLGTVFKITTSGTETVLQSLGGLDGANPYGGLIQASDGNFYGMTYSGGSNILGTVLKLN